MKKRDRGLAAPAEPRLYPIVFQQQLDSSAFGVLELSSIETDDEKRKSKKEEERRKIYTCGCATAALFLLVV